MVTAPNHNVSPLSNVLVQLNNGQSQSYAIPKAGWAGRMWPKVGCDANGLNCAFGDSSPPCPSTGCQPPADTKVEFFIPAEGVTGDSWYDVSLVDGYSLPMKIAPRTASAGGCVPTTCAVPLASCPTDESVYGDLRVIVKGKVVACLSPCKKWNYPSPYGLGKSETLEPGVYMCCPTPPISPEQCRAGAVVDTKYVDLVQTTCPSAYSYAYDDLAGLHNCPSPTSFDVTLCP